LGSGRRGSGATRLADRTAPASDGNPEEVIHYIDEFDIPLFLEVAAAFGATRYGYVVTPNVDHFIRCHEDAFFRAIYSSAEYVLLDSVFLARLLRVLKGHRLTACPGSDVFSELLKRVVSPSDPLVLIGGSPSQAKMIEQAYGLQNLRHWNPPMGFIRDPIAVEECLRFIEAGSPFRFCFIVVGSPQQEQIAHLLLARGRARGLAFCLGASLDFATGVERRAPQWMRHLALEWLYRLVRNPGRLAGRYLVRGPRIFSYLRRARIVSRPIVIFPRDQAVL
ncbi:MAG: WecB/TagA/CpsF family glycosyltransferase, partial [Terriglobia bacterium]